MGRTPWAVVGFVGLLAAGCAAGPIELAVEPVDPAVPVDDLAFENDDPTPTQTPSADELVPEAFAAMVVVDVERSYVFDGTYVPEFTAPAMRWTVLADVDEAQEYAYLTIGGVAEPGDSGCIEAIETSDGVFSRSSFDGGRMGDFEASADSSPLIDSYEAAFPRSAADLAAVHGTEPWAETETASGGVESTVVLTADGVAKVRAMLVEPGGIDTAYDSGTLVTVEDADGQLLSLSLDAVYETDGARETLAFDLAYVPPRPRVALDSPWTPNSGCPSAAADVSGAWKVVSVDTTAVADLPSLNEATLLWGADGGFSGTTGCQTFTGRTDFGYSWFDDAELTPSGAPCEGIEGAIEAQLLAVLGGSADVVFDDDGDLVLASTDRIVVLSPL